MDRVVGPGVIGYFPVLRPGAPPFVYASQTAVKYPSRAPSAGVPPELLAHPAPSWFVPGGANEDDLTWHVAPARLCGIMRGSFQFWYVLVSESGPEEAGPRDAHSFVSVGVLAIWTGCRATWSVPCKPPQTIRFRRLTRRSHRSRSPACPLSSDANKIEEEVRSG